LTCYVERAVNVLETIDRLLQPEALSEKLVVQRPDSRKNYARMVYEAYRAAKPNGSLLDRAYKILIESNNMLFKRMLSKIDVDFVDDYEENGYTSAKDMVRKMQDSGTLRIDKRFSDSHPYFSPEENWIFRAVHDYYTHGLRGKDFEHAFNFDLKGEFQTYNVHAKLAPRAALPALFSEVVAQVSFEITTGRFPDPQKCAALYGIDFINIGEIACKPGDKTSKFSLGTYDDNFPNGDARAYLSERSREPEKALIAYDYFCDQQ